MSLSELEELPPFLEHTNPEVRLQALTILQSFTGDEKNLDFIQGLDIIGPLVRLISDRVTISKAVLVVLVNLSEHEEMSMEMLDAGVIDVIMPIVGKPPPKCPSAVLEGMSMLLANLTRNEEGQLKVMQEGSNLEGLHFRRIIKSFSDPILTDEDPFQYLGLSLVNLSQLPSARTLLLDKDRGILQRAILPQLQSENAKRRICVTQMIRNCFLDAGNIDYLLSKDADIYPQILYPIIGGELMTDDEKKGMHPLIVDKAQPTKRRDLEIEVRRAVVDILALCGRQSSSQEFLRREKIFPLLQYLHAWEQQFGQDKEMDELLYDVVPLFIDEKAAAENNAASIAEAMDKKGAEIEEIDSDKDEDEADEEEIGDLAAMTEMGEALSEVAKTLNKDKPERKKSKSLSSSSTSSSSTSPSSTSPSSDTASSLSTADGIESDDEMPGLA